jgi:hypothetical protein
MAKVLENLKRHLEFRKTVASSRADCEPLILSGFKSLETTHVTLPFLASNPILQPSGKAQPTTE